MSWYVRMALRNLTRRLGRSSLSMVSVVIGVLVIIAGRGFVQGLTENIIRAQVDSMSGHVLVRPADYPTRGVQHPVDNLLELNDEQRAWLDENAKAWTLRVMFVPRAVKGMDAVRVRAFGFDPDTDEAVFPRTNWTVDGKVPATAADGVLISRGVARVLEIGIGDPIIFESRTAAGAINALELPVSGIVSTGNPAIDHLGAFVPKPVVDRLILPEERFSHLAVRLNRREGAPAAAVPLAELFPGAQVLTWVDETDDLLNVQRLRQRMLDIIALALLAIAATGIANTVLMAAYERVREIGTLRALGMTRTGVIGLFVSEGFVMGTLGSLLGGALGAWMVWHYSKDGIDLTPLIEQDQAGTVNIPFQAVLYMHLSWSVVVGAMLFGLLIAVVASIYPAVLASRLLPADAVRAT